MKIMKYTYEQNQEFALKLMLIETEKALQETMSIRRGSKTNKELLKIIKKFEDK